MSKLIRVIRNAQSVPGVAQRFEGFSNIFEAHLAQQINATGLAYGNWIFVADANSGQTGTAVIADDATFFANYTEVI